MKNNSETRAFLRTDRAIMEAMIRLLSDKSFESITVQDILDETPVSRATFYAHYHDKYEIAEKMQTIFFECFKEIRMLFSQAQKIQYTEIIRKSVLKNGPLINALLKIRTDRVDIRSVAEQESRRSYLEKHHGKNAQAEADLYAEMMTSYYFTCYRHIEDALKDPDYYDHVMVPVMVAVFNQDQNPEFRKAIVNFLPGKDF